MVEFSPKPDKSTEVIEGELWNMYSRSCRFVHLNMERSKAPDRFVNAKVYANDLLLGILKCSPKVMEVKELRTLSLVPLNMLFI